VRTRRALVWAAGGLLAVLCCSGVAASPVEGADRIVTSEAGLNLDAFLGTFAWDANAGLSFSNSGTGPDRLVLFSHGHARLAPVAPWRLGDQPFPSLAPDGNGAPVAAYPRCTRFDCDLFELSVRSGREHKLRSLSSRRWSEQAVAVWGRHYLFSRPFCPHPARTCPGTGLFVSPPLRRVADAPVRSFDLRGPVVAFTAVRSPNVTSDTDTVVTAYLTGRPRPRQCVVADARQLRAHGLRHASVVLNPSLTRRFVYWIAGPDGSAEETGPHFALRRRIPTRRCRQRGPIEKLRTVPSDTWIDRIAVTGGRVFYTVPYSDFAGLKVALREMTDPPVHDP